MKTILNIIGTILLAAGMVGVASATPVTFAVDEAGSSVVLSDVIR